MASPKRRSIAEIYDLFTYIETGAILEPFKVQRAIKDAQKIDDHFTSMMIIGLAHAAGGEHEIAASYLKEASESNRENIYLNYITYLEKTFQYDAHISALKDMAKKNNHLIVNWVAKNRCLSLAEFSQAEFFLERVLELVDNDKQELKEKYIADFRSEVSNIEKFMSKSVLSEEEIKAAAKIAFEVAREHNVLFSSHEFDVGGDDECPAFIFNAYSLDSSVLSDMDIELATRLATDTRLADKDFTAWYRGVEDKKEDRL